MLSYLPVETCSRCFGWISILLRIFQENSRFIFSWAEIVIVGLVILCRLFLWALCKKHSARHF
ncbi:hypothetical protein BDN70DRAFT_484527 [Pholiota conissans]|uniref:Uncharacterized protein n=1 Tax=Pholiota conissans TaxID=109636 RepID=A0A9P5Z877_9AGAR|nr:hypothetical protein BDN70DRAFT_484527 [Pholiota conissans]